MKRAIILPLSTAFVLLSLLASAQTMPARKEETKAKVKTQTVKMKVKGDLNAVPLPYPVTYSSQFMPGDPAYAKTVLDIWKDFENNTLDNSAGHFADTIVIYSADGTVLRGLQNAMDGAKTYRSSMASLANTVDAVMSVHSIDKDEDWVLVWGNEKVTDKSGQSKTMPLHELWRINKDGKIDMVIQYTNVAPKD